MARQIISEEERNRFITIFREVREGHEIPSADITFAIRKLLCIQNISGRFMLEKLRAIDEELFNEINIINADYGIKCRGFSSMPHTTSVSDTSFQDKRIMKKDDAIERHKLDIATYITPFFVIYQFLYYELPDYIFPTVDNDIDRTLKEIYELITKNVFRNYHSFSTKLADYREGRNPYQHADIFSRFDDYDYSTAPDALKNNIGNRKRNAHIQLPYLSEEQVQYLCELRQYNDTKLKSFSAQSNSPLMLYDTYIAAYKNRKDLYKDGDFDKYDRSTRASIAIWAIVDYWCNHFKIGLTPEVFNKRPNLRLVTKSKQRFIGYECLD